MTSISHARRELGRFRMPMPGIKCQNRSRLAEVRGNEQKGHEEGGYGEQFAEDDYFLYSFEAVQVGRDG
jgi:hypothetical protein